jgi:N-acetylglucosaminyldiphosphoundecaprenol N-acetyl-beta-D-mannosaminyltransferase
LDAVNCEATFVLADGMPLVWASRWRDRPLPERVTGSDLIYALAERASWKAYRVFFLGGAPGIADRAAATLAERFPGLIVAGVESPPFRPLTREEQQGLMHRIREARPHLLLVAFGQPKGELWIAEHCQELGVPACVQLGASFDFVAGNVARSPRWLGRLGLEWAHRLWLAPRRLGPRYAANAWFLLRALCGRCRLGSASGRGVGRPRGELR